MGGRGVGASNIKSYLPGPGDLADLADFEDLALFDAFESCFRGFGKSMFLKKFRKGRFGRIECKGSIAIFSKNIIKNELETIDRKTQFLEAISLNYWNFLKDYWKERFGLN